MGKIYFDGSGENGKGIHGAWLIIDEYEDHLDYKVYESINDEIYTNNEMEYLGFIRAALFANNEDTIVGDSQLVIKQLLGEYKLKANNLKMLYTLAKDLINIKQLKLEWVPREQNLAGNFLEKYLKKSHNISIKIEENNKISIKESYVKFSFNK